MNFEGTTAVTVIYGDFEYVASVVDGRGSVNRSLVPPESFRYVVQGNMKKVFNIGEQYIATAAGWGDYCMMAINKILEIYSNNTHGFSMKEIVEETEHFCVKEWEKDPDGGVDKEFPSSVVVYGFDGVHIISPNRKKVVCVSGTLVDSETVVDSETGVFEGKEVKIIYHGSGGQVTSDHLFAIAERISSSPLDTMACIMEALGVSAISNPTTGGFLLGATLTKTESGCPCVSIYDEQTYRPHISNVVAQRFDNLKNYLSFSLLVFTPGSYCENPREEGEWEKSLKDTFGEKLVSMTLVGVRKGKRTARLLNFDSVEARSNAEPLLTDMRLEYDLPSQKELDELANVFVDPNDCL